MLQLTSTALAHSRAKRMQSAFTQNSAYVHREIHGDCAERKEREYKIRELSTCLDEYTVCQTCFFVIFVSPQFYVLKSFNEDQFDHQVGRPLDLVDLISGSLSMSSMLSSIVIVVVVAPLVPFLPEVQIRKIKYGKEISDSIWEASISTKLLY